MNAVGAALWVLAGLIVTTIPDPHVEVVRVTRSVTVSPDGKSITTKVTTTNPDGSKTVTETVEELDDCEV
jgi:hypothetical protein